MCLNTLYEMKTVGVTSFTKKLLILSVIFSFFLTSNVTAQILVAGTTFDPINPTTANTRAYIGANDILFYGVQGGALSIGPAIAPNVNAGVFNANFYHAITNNPYKLDNVMYNNLATTDYQLVYSPKPNGSGNQNVLQYKVNHLVPNSVVSVQVEYCSAVSPTYAPCNNQDNHFKAIINPDGGNLNNGSDVSNVKPGMCASLNLAGTADANGDMVFRLNAARDGVCTAMGIKSIEVRGFIKPSVRVAEGSEVCTGEQITIQSPTDYNASYKYQVSTNGGGSWTDLPGSPTAKQVLYEVNTTGTYQFRLVVTPPSSSPVTSDPVTVNAIACCMQNGFPASRQTIYYDNFGRLNMANTAGTEYYVWDYSDQLNPKEVLRTTATPFRWQLTPPPLGAAFVATGPPNDGQYTVAAYLTANNSVDGIVGARLQWANRITGRPDPVPELHVDHSGSPDGGVLLLNCPEFTGGDTLYKRVIPTNCSGKQVFFECWIAVFTHSASGAYNGVDVNVFLQDSGDPTNTRIINGTATRFLDGGGVWVKISGSLFLTGNSLRMAIINNKDSDLNGNDLALDDIKVMACAPPPVDAYFDIPTLLQKDAICNDLTLPLYLKPSTMLKNFYGGTPRYVFQWTRTPTVVSSWQNLNTPTDGVPGESYVINNPRTHPTFAGLTEGGKVYFRVVAASGPIFTQWNNFQGAGNYANINNPCKNYSVSEAIEAQITCPLPVELASFKAFKNGDKTQLAWSTSSEKDNRYFIIERSSDGIEFTAIGQVEGLGNSDHFQTYQFLDENPLNGISYYRLKQVDFDGRYDYSKTVSVNDTQSDVTVYPNPNNGSFSVQIFAPGQSYLLEIGDAQGRIVYTASGNEVPESLKVDNIPSGFYTVRLSTDTQVITRKLIVH